MNSDGTPVADQQVQIIDWNDTARDLDGKLDQEFIYQCPAKGTIYKVWGTDIYTSSSSICSAAVHAGSISAKDGGEVQIKIRPGQEFYNGSARNGVTSDRFSRYRWSFQIIQ
ncbi:MAG: LCCL domain-containing protein [Thermosynechococcaceae cyanobacterium]